MIEQLATSIRTKKTKLHHQFGIQKKTSAGCVRRGTKNRNRGSTINAQGPELGRQKFHRKLTQQKWITKQTQIVDGVFPQVMYRTLYLLSGPGYWITVSPTLILQVILPVGPKIGTAHACFLCKPWMAYVIAKIVFRFSRICLQGPDSLMFHLRRFSTPAYFETNVLKELPYIKMGKQQEHVYLVADGSY